MVYYVQSLKFITTQQVVAKFESCDEFSSGSITVVYLDEQQEKITYGIDGFLAAADIAPQHIETVNLDEDDAVLSLEQKAFVPHARGEVQPLEKKQICTPAKW